MAESTIHPLLSVIIPAYNCERYLDKCITELLKLNRDDVQIIVINDGSTDRTEYMLEELRKEYAADNFVIVSQCNAGVSSARNKGIDYANGRYIAFYDADDEILPNEFIQVLTKLSQLTPEVDFYMTSYSHADNGSEKIMNPPLTPGTHHSGEDSAALLHALLDNKFAIRYDSKYIGGKVYQYYVRKDYLNSHNITFPVSIHYAEDLCYCLQLVKNVGTFYIDYITCYRYMVYSTSASHRYRENYWEELKKVYLEISKIVVPSKQLLYAYAKTAIQYYIHCGEDYQKLKKNISLIIQDAALRNIDYNGLFDNWSFKEKLINYCMKHKYTRILIFLLKV